MPFASVRAGRRSRRARRARSRDQLPGAVRSARVAVRARRAGLAMGQPIVDRRRSQSPVDPHRRRRRRRRARHRRGAGAVRPLVQPLVGCRRRRAVRCAAGARRTPGWRSASRDWRRNSSTCRRPRSSASPATSRRGSKSSTTCCSRSVSCCSRSSSSACPAKDDPDRGIGAGPQHRRGRIPRALRDSRASSRRMPAWCGIASCSAPATPPAQRGGDAGGWHLVGGLRFWF